MVKMKNNLGPTTRFSCWLQFKKFSEEKNLKRGCYNDGQALSQGPHLNIVVVAKEELVVSGFLGSCLALVQQHFMDTLVYPLDGMLRVNVVKRNRVNT